MAETDYLEELNKAVFTILKADATLMALATDIYDNVPEDQAVYPYVAIGQVDDNAFLTFDDDGDEGVYSIDIFGKSLSLSVIYKIAKRIKFLLARSDDALGVAGACVTMFSYGGVIVNPNRNMETEGRQITLEFNFKIL